MLATMNQEGENTDAEGDVVSLVETIFPPVAPVLARNFVITDTYYLSPPQSGLGIPGPDEGVFDIDPKGLAHAPDDVVAELPDRCRLAFDEARAEEATWKATWNRESLGRAKANVHISYNGMTTKPR